VTTDITDLPHNLPEVQSGEPLGQKEIDALPPDQQEAYEVLFALVVPHYEGKKPVDAESQEALKKAYMVAKGLGMDRYCPVVRAGAAFELDSKAMEIVSRAIAMAETRFCFGCH